MDGKKLGGHLISLGVVLGMSVALRTLIRTGSCGGPEFPPCPDGIGPFVALIPISIIGVFVAMAMGSTWAFPGIFLGVGLGSLAAIPGGPSDVKVFAGIFGGIFTVTGLGLFAGFLGGKRFASAKQAKANDLMGNGRLAIGTLRSVRDTGITINDNPRAEVTVWIQPKDGSDGWNADKTITMSRVQPLIVGSRFPVLVDPADPTVWALVTQLHDRSQAPTRVLDLWDEIHGTAPLAAAPPPMPEWPVEDAVDAAAADPDPIAQLERLRDLHTSGAITDEEYAEAKAMVLDDD